MSNAKKIAVIGAGVSGLIAALELEKKGHSVVVFDEKSQVGGRVNSHSEEGYFLDEGFQVLLTAYPAAREYLNYDALKLRYFQPGALIYTNGGAYRFGDPLRKISFALSTLLAPVSSLSDMWKIFRLRNWVLKLSEREIFEFPEKSTMSFLREYGFSERIIKQFFVPFYGGIFLESELLTSHRMFLFVFKMFSRGNAAVPEKGIGEISRYLASQIKGEMALGEKVISRTGTHIETSKGRSTDFDLVVMAYPTEETKWHGCRNLYFKTPVSSIRAPLIGLVAESESIINNLHFVTDLKKNRPRYPERSLLSVTVLANFHLSQEELISQVIRELEHYCGIDEVEFLSLYDIPQALPVFHTVKYEPHSEDLITDEPGVFRCGDFTVNASLNAAMLSGKKVAELADQYGRNS